jgi:hypothetical protein
VAASADMQQPSCTFEKDVDVGEPGTIVTSIRGLVDGAKCCAACYANAKCSVAVVLPAGVGPGPGCWLKTGAGKTYPSKGKTTCRTTRTPAKPIGYCLVKVLVQPAINIWVGLPSDGSFNDRFMSLGGGGFVGSVGEPTKVRHRWRGLVHCVELTAGGAGCPGWLRRRDH